MVHPYIINILNALVLIVVGIVSYLTEPSNTTTNLVPAFIGLLFLAASYHLRKHNRFVFHTITALTLFTGIVLLAQINTQSFSWDKQTVTYTIMGISCFVSVAFYVGTFIKERRLGDNTIFKDDL